ncbi:MAG: hypothetical protein MR516_06935 [Bacteroidales bacterium]|nr:hypothetical protein [Bacteroidales bacterium]
MKTKLLLIAWLCLHAVQALAEFTPSGTKVYTIKNLKNSNYAAYNAAVMSGSNNILTAVSAINAYSFFIVEASGDGDGYFTIKVAGKERYYVYAINTNDANSNVGVKQLAEGALVGDECKWSLTKNNPENNPENNPGYYNIIPKGGANGWNIRGDVSGVSTIGQWSDNSTNDNRWQLSEVTTENLQSFVPTVGTTYGQVATEYPHSSTINEAWRTFSAIAEESRTQDDVITLCQVLQTTVEVDHWRNYLYLPSGYYYIHSAQESGDNNPYGAYWFDDPYNVLGTWNNPKGYTLGMVPTEAQKVKNNFIWKVTRGDLPNTSVGIVNGTGSNVKGNEITATSSLTLGLSSTYAEGTVYFTQGTHLSNQAHYTLGKTKNADAEATRTNPFFLTQWAHNDSEGSKVKLEAVVGMDIYTVAIPSSVMSGIPSEGLALTQEQIQVTRTSTGEIMPHGGFFAVPTGTPLQPSDFTAPVVNGKEYTFAIDAENKTLTLEYREPTSSAAVISKAELLLSKGGKVGYPTTSTTVYTDLQTAVNTAKNAGENVTTDQLNAVITATNAFLSYGANTGETDITYPEVGKAYTMSFVACTGQKFYMNYDAAGYTCVETSDQNNTNYPDEAILVCVKDLGNHKYVFRNLDRKFFAWKGNGAGENGAKGYADTYQTYTYATIGQFLKSGANGGGPAASSQSDLSGAVTVKGIRTGTTENYFVYKFDDKRYDKATDYYYTRSFTSAIYIEEVEKYDVYSMNVEGNTSLLIGEMMPEEVTLTREATRESETQTYGFFISQQGVVPAASEFSAPDKGYKKATITVDGTNKVVNVAYALTTDWEELLALANKLLSTERVGYPAINSSLRTRLSEAVASSNVETLQTAIDNYMSTTEEDIILPKDGQAYTMTAATKDGKKFYMKYTDDGYTMVETTESDNTNYPEEAILICRDLGNGKYAFQNTAGKYMCWKGNGSNGYNSGKGFFNKYSADHTWIGVEKIVVGKSYNGIAESSVEGVQPNLFGAVAVSGYRNYADHNNKAYYVINKTSGAYEQAGAPLYNNGYTSAILIEPVATVTYNPQPPMNNSEGAISEEIKKVATYSAPIATVVPSNVKAYYVSASEGAGGQATLVAWPAAPNGQQVLPANTGVILTSTDADATLAALTPATSETKNELPSGSTNLLRNTAAGPHTFTADEGFILAKGTYGVGLYKAKAGSTLARNKAYLTYSNPSQSASTAVRMVIGGNTPTDITHLMPQEDVDEQAPIYDLSGRRVQHTVKGGLYIRNGRKFIVR